MSAVLYHNDDQRMAIERAFAEREDGKRKVQSEVQKYSQMTLAEDYHQKYYLRRNKTIALELKQRFQTLQDLSLIHI